jgi:hypothetical protein
VLDPARHHEQLPGLEPHVVAVAELMSSRPLEHPEELVGVVVVVPDEVALELGELDLEVVDLRGDPRAPGLVEGASAAARLTLSGMPGAYGAALPGSAPTVTAMRSTEVFA